MDFQEQIRLQNLLRKVNIVKASGVLDDIKKGHMDFSPQGGSGQKPKNAKNQLVQKKITDKRGRQTTRWVRADKDEKVDKKPKKGDEVDEKTTKTKTVSDESKEKLLEFARGESSEDLKQYIEEMGSVEKPQTKAAVEAAKKVLQERGELDNGDDGENNDNNKGNEGEIDRDELSNKINEDLKEKFGENVKAYPSRMDDELIEIDFGNEDYEGFYSISDDVWVLMDSESGEERHFDNFNDFVSAVDGGAGDSSENITQQFENHPKKDEILKIALETNIPIASAMQIVDSQNNNSDEIHQKIDAAQQALDDLKNSTGHPDMNGENNTQKEINEDLYGIDSLLNDLDDAYDGMFDYTGFERALDERNFDYALDMLSDIYDMAQENNNPDAQEIVSILQEKVNEMQDATQENGEIKSTFPGLEVDPDDPDYYKTDDDFEPSRALLGYIDLEDQYLAGDLDEDEFRKQAQLNFEDENDFYEQYGKYLVNDTGLDKADTDETLKNMANVIWDSKVGDKNQPNQNQPNSNFNGDMIREWIGDEYSDEHIQSVIDALNDAEGLDFYITNKPQFDSQEQESEWYDDMVKEASSDIRDGMWHSDMDRKDVENVIWGLLRAKNS